MHAITRYVANDNDHWHSSTFGAWSFVCVILCAPHTVLSGEAPKSICIPLGDSFTHSCVFIHSFTHSFTHSLTHSFKRHVGTDSLQSARPRAFLATAGRSGAAMRGPGAGPAASATCWPQDCAGPSGRPSRLTPPPARRSAPREAGLRGPHLGAPLSSGFWSTLASGGHRPEMDMRREWKVSSDSSLLTMRHQSLKLPSRGFPCTATLGIPSALTPSRPRVVRALRCHSPRERTIPRWFH